MDQPDGLTRLVRTSSPPHPRAGRHRLRRSRCGGRSGSPGRGPASPPSEGRWPRGCPRRRSSRVVSSEMRDSSSRLLDAVPQVRPMSQRGASMACCTSKPKSIIRVSRARLGLRLAFATHGAVGQHRRTVPEQHGRDDAVEGGSCKARAGSGGGRRARRSCRGSASARRCRRRPRPSRSRSRSTGCSTPQGRRRRWRRNRRCRRQLAGGRQRDRSAGPARPRRSVARAGSISARRSSA